MLLILDLDETLIHSRDAPLEVPPHFYVGPYSVYKRPYLDEFVDFCRLHFQVAVWTSSGSDYAAQIVGGVFGSNYPLQFVWSSERCTMRVDSLTNRYESLKNLSKVKRRGYSLERVLMVDDTPAKLARSYGNLIRVTPFEGDPRDAELKHLMPYLHSLKDIQNVRCIEKRHWRNQGAYTSAS